MAERSQASGGAPAVQAEGLHRFFHSGEEEVPALRDVSLQVRAGEFVAVVGPSGSGKSTLMTCLAGLDEPDGGTVHVDGVRITRRSETERSALRARLIGVLTQGGNLLEHLSVQQNIALVRSIIGHARHDATPAENLLDLLGLETRRQASPTTLSGGEAVRAALAVALANDPVLLLADEPTGELDSGTERQVLELLRTRSRLGTAMIVASHSAAVRDAADRVIILRDGRLV